MNVTFDKEYAESLKNVYRLPSETLVEETEKQKEKNTQ